VINHLLLKRQLKKINASDAVLPKNLEDWQTFLNLIDKTYLENEQDHYTIERALEVSSKEMQDLYDAFDAAQKIAQVGSWTYNLNNAMFTWSNEMYRLCTRDILLGPPSIKEFLSYVHTDDKHLFTKATQNIFYNGYSASIEFRIVVSGEERWMEAKYKILTKDDTALVELITGTLADINERKLVDEKIFKLHAQLMTAARRAGMAEVASSVLHNIGNVLNSLNVSASILLEKFENGKENNITKISDLINAHKEDLGEFITNDSKGKHIPEYLSCFATYWDNEQKDYIKLLTAMNEYIQHIKDIVTRQQSLSGSYGMIQPVHLDEVINDAILIAIPDNQKVNIEVLKEFQLLKETLVDKAVLLQILVNVLRNAMESLNESKKENKQIHIKLTLSNSTTVSISVEDNGTGVSSENVKNIFTYAFTTKERGFGIGLHTSLLAARGMGGDLKMFNLGKDKGAIFVLTFPYKIK
jgi:signal transduction histidine kinase